MRKGTWFYFSGYSKSLILRLCFKSSLQFVALLENYNPCKMCFLELGLGRHPLVECHLRLQCNKGAARIITIEQRNVLWLQFTIFKVGYYSYFSIFDVQATGGDNDEEEDEAKWDNDFEKNSLRRLVKSFWDSSISCQTVRYFVTLKLGNFDYGTSIFGLAFLQNKVLIWKV